MRVDNKKAPLIGELAFARYEQMTEGDEGDGIDN